MAKKIKKSTQILEEVLYLISVNGYTYNQAKTMLVKKYNLPAKKNFNDFVGGVKTNCYLEATSKLLQLSGNVCTLEEYKVFLKGLREKIENYIKEGKSNVELKEALELESVVYSEVYYKLLQVLFNNVTTISEYYKEHQSFPKWLGEDEQKCAKKKKIVKKDVEDKIAVIKSNEKELQEELGEELGKPVDSYSNSWVKEPTPVNHSIVELKQAPCDYDVDAIVNQYSKNGEKYATMVEYEEIWGIPTGVVDYKMIDIILSTHISKMGTLLNIDYFIQKYDFPIEFKPLLMVRLNLLLSSNLVKATGTYYTVEDRILKKLYPIFGDYVGKVIQSIPELGSIKKTKKFYALKAREMGYFYKGNPKYGLSFYTEENELLVLAGYKRFGKCTNYYTPWLTLDTCKEYMFEAGILKDTDNNVVMKYVGDANTDIKRMLSRSLEELKQEIGLHNLLDFSWTYDKDSMIAEYYKQDDIHRWISDLQNNLGVESIEQVVERAKNLGVRANITQNEIVESIVPVLLEVGTLKEAAKYINWRSESALSFIMKDKGLYAVIISKYKEVQMENTRLIEENKKLKENTNTQGIECSREVLEPYFKDFVDSLTIANSNSEIALYSKLVGLSDLLSK